MKVVACNLLGHPYFLDELEQDAIRNIATIAAMGRTMRRVDFFCIINLLVIK